LLHQALVGLELLIRSKRDTDRLIEDWRDAATKIITAGLSSGDEECISRATAAVNMLVGLGHVEFLTLLKDFGTD
jgi:hypothetical protein